MTAPLSIEDVYDAMARAIDTLESAQGPDAMPDFLARLSLALAQAINDPARVLALIDACLAGPDP